MTPDRVRAMVSAMQAAGEDDDAIRSALTLAKSQEGIGIKPPMMDAEPGPYRSGYTLPPSKEEVNKRRSDLNEATLRNAGGPQTVYTSPEQASAERSAADDEQFNKTAGAIGSGFTDSFALGMPGRILDLLPDKAAHYLGGTHDERAAARQASPAGDVVGRTFGGGLSGVAGPEALMAKGIQSSLPAATTALGRIGVNTVAGAGTNALAEGARAANEGAGLREAGKRALVGGVWGAGIAGGMSAAGELAGAASGAIRSNPQTKRYLDAKEAGVYDEPAMSSLPAGRQGMQEAADTTVEKMAGREKSLADNAEAAWNLTGSDPAVLKKPVDTQLIKGVLHAGRLKHIDPDTGMPADGSDSIVAAYDKAIERTPANATVEGTLKRRQSMKKAAAFDNPNPTPEQMAARDVYHTFRTAVRDASPELATADDAFSTHSKAADRRAELVGTDLTNADPAQLEGASARIGRVGDENVPGMRVQKRLAELQASDPEIAAAIDFLANKKAQEAVRFGMPHMPTHFSAATLMSGIPRLVGQNARALGAKVVDPMARGISGASQTAARALPSFLPQIEQEYADAMQRLRQQQQENQ